MTETAVFGHGAVVAPHRLAGEAGLQILAQGGNAIETMVAMAATIAVVYPHANSIGGDGFWLIADAAGRVRFIDAAGRAGAECTIARYRRLGHDTIPTRGPLAALTVPGAVSGWSMALEAARALGGRLPLDVLLADAIGQARQGVPVSPSQSRVPAIDIAELALDPGFRDVLMAEGKPLAAGAPMVQSALAATLEQLSHAGLDDFYKGDVAREMAADLERVGSLLTREDLRQHEARRREPLAVALAGGTLYGTPPPTQGLATLVAIGIFERLGVRQAESFEHVHGLVEAVKRAIALRDRVVTDPAFSEFDPTSALTSTVLDREAAGVSMARSGASPGTSLSGDTVYMGAIDDTGLSVSYIQSVFWDFGSGVFLPGTGIVMHNRGISFSLDPASVNPLTPGRRPFHTLNPTLAVFDDGRIMPFGTMGGDAQPQIQAQIFSRYRLGMGLADAIDAPRFVLGQRWGERRALLHVEDRFDERVISALDRAGHEIVVDGPYSDDFGHAGALVRHPRGRIEASHDPRADGGAYGL